MTAHAAAPDALDAETLRQRRYFVLRRFHSLSGIIPVGLFLIEHLWTNSKAIQGRTCFGNAVDEIIHLPFLPVIEVLGIFLPLTFHALYGIKLAFEAKENGGAYGYGRKWPFLMQRVTGVLTFLFILLHLKDFRIAKLFGTMMPEQFFDQLSFQLSSPAKAILYELGVTCAVFHFSNGLRTFLFAWGATVSQRSQRWAGWACAAMGLGLWFLGTNTVLFFATGGSSFVPSSMTRGENGRDLCEPAMTPLPPALSREATTQTAPAAPR